MLALPAELLQQQLFFSLDNPTFQEDCGPIRHHAMQQQRHCFGPDAVETVRLLHHCDYTMKELSMGVEVNALTFECHPATRLQSRLPHYLVDLLKPIHTRKGVSKRSLHRLWFESGDVKFQRVQGDVEEFFLDTPVIRVRAHPLEFDERGDHQDTLEDAPPEDEASQFARAMTLCMGNLTQYFPEFSWLAEIPKMQRIALELVDHNKFLQARCDAQKEHFPEKLASLRGQIPEWPHRVRTRHEILQSLSDQNPHATRAEIEARPVFRDSLADAPDQAQRMDEQILDQLVQFFSSSQHTGYEELRTAIREWLDHGRSHRLLEIDSQEVRAPLKVFEREIASFGRLGGAPMPDEITYSLVPAAVAIEENSNACHLVYGGGVGCLILP